MKPPVFSSFSHCLVSVALLGASLAHAVPYPQVSGPRITRCTDVRYPCGWDVYYTSDGVQFTDTMTVGAPAPGSTLKLVTWGIHCSWGDARTGVPFSECVWTGGHSPLVYGKCELQNHSSWALTADSTCSVAASWGPHQGAGPGGECAVFAQNIYGAGHALPTPYGILDPTVVANSGNAFCEKPLPPNISCSIELPQVIDHGVINPNASSTASIEGLITCGGRPVVTVVGGDRLDMRGGVTTALSIELVGDSHVRVKSVMNAVDASPGPHQASAIVRVSPY